MRRRDLGGYLGLLVEGIRHQEMSVFGEEFNGVVQSLQGILVKVNNGWLLKSIFL